MGFRRLSVASAASIALMAQVSCGPARQGIFPTTPVETITASPFPVIPLTAAASPVELSPLDIAPTVPTVPCIEFVASTDPESGPLSILYSTDCLADPELTPTRLWQWNVATRQTAALPIPEDARGPRPSSDLSLILFLREVDEASQELWLIDRDGSHERRLARNSLAELRQRYPAAYSIRTNYGWIQDTHTVFYEARALFEFEEDTVDSLVLVEGTTGVVQSMIRPGQVFEQRYSPDGSQIAAISRGELRLINAVTGQAHSVPSLGTIPYVQNPLQYSPDGRFLAVLVDKGVAIVDTATGSHQDVSIDYIAWGAGDAALFMHPLHWRDNSTLLMLAANPLEVAEEDLDLFTELLDWEFGVYLLDASRATIVPIQVVRGIYPSALLSPDLNHLGYARAIRDSTTQELYVVDLTSGAQMLYATGDQAGFVSWAPDSSRFFFGAFVNDEWKLYLGQVGREPIPFEVHSITWLDEEQFVAKPASSDLQLHLYTVYGENTLVASVQPAE